MTQHDLKRDGVGQMPAVDLANTVVGGEQGETIDALETPAQLTRWLEVQGDRIGAVGEDTALRVQDFRTLRQAIRGTFLAASRGEPVPPVAVRTLNDASASMPGYVQLDASDPAAPWVTVAGTAGSRTAAILAIIARSAIEILGGEERTRLRVCGARRCGRFFLAARPGQLWCSTACGNRARVARHYARASAAR